MGLFLLPDQDDAEDILAQPRDDRLRRWRSAKGTLWWVGLYNAVCTFLVQILLAAVLLYADVAGTHWAPHAVLVAFGFAVMTSFFQAAASAIPYNTPLTRSAHYQFFGAVATTLFHLIGSVVFAIGVVIADLVKCSSVLCAPNVFWFLVYLVASGLLLASVVLDGVAVAALYRMGRTTYIDKDRRHVAFAIPAPLDRDGHGDELDEGAPREVVTMATSSRRQWQ